ncbi:MAG: DUF4139 domain-containing protein [Allosphingosinicella sp.]
MTVRVALLALFLGTSAGLAAAQTVAVSPAPDSVDVTVYRDPNRPADQRLRLSWLNGFALISETRQITLPAGESEIRFEGVAGGIVPQSAIVTGLPEGIVERNRDAYLLSAGTLLERSLGRRVHLRRTSSATGAVTEQEAIVRSGLGGAVVLQTAAGFEALRCTGLNETLVYDEAPAGLSAKPTLSVRARVSQPLAATVTLSYLATGFDWQASYVADLAADGETMALLGWLTLANGDETGFVEADTQAVAGRVNRRYTPRQPVEAPPLRITCWPQDTTSDTDGEEIIVTGSRVPAPAAMMAPPPPPPPPPAPPAAAPPTMVAEQEDLGDLKLYRIPEPVTVASRAQKQVALLDRSGVAAKIVYRQRFEARAAGMSVPASRVLVTRNRSEEGLGLPLPAGRLVLFARAGGRRVLIGQGYVSDRAVGEDVEVVLGPATGVHTALVLEQRADGKEGYAFTVTNDQAVPVPFEAEFFTYGAPMDSDATLGTRDGRPLWSATVPANGRVTLRYRLEEPKRPEPPQPPPPPPPAG